MVVQIDPPIHLNWRGLSFPSPSPLFSQVKKGLEKLYRRVEKEVSEEELQVVWGAMQEAFMEQYRRFEVSEAHTHTHTHFMHVASNPGLPCPELKVENQSGPTQNEVLEIV